MDILEADVLLKRPWDIDVFPQDRVVSRSEAKDILRSYLTTSIEGYHFNLFFQSRQDILISYVYKYYDLVFSSERSFIENAYLTGEDMALLANFAQVASYLFYVSVKINEDFEIDFYYFTNQLNSYSIADVEVLLLDDFLNLRKAKKQLEYLPALLRYDPLQQIEKNINGGIELTDFDLEILANENNVRDVFDNIDSGLAYFRSNSQANQVEDLTKIIEATMLDIENLKKTMKKKFSTRGSVNEEVNPLINSKTISLIESEAQLMMDPSLDLDVDSLLNDLSVEQVKSCDEINMWSKDIKHKVSEYFKQRKESESGNPQPSAAITDVGQEMDILTLEFEAKLKLTLSKKLEIEQLMASKMQALSDLYSKGNTADTMVTWLKEVTAEKFLTSEKVSNLLSSIYSNMISNYIQENRTRKVLRPKSYL